LKTMHGAQTKTPPHPSKRRTARKSCLRH
jgi:hypothetical protein